MQDRQVQTGGPSCTCRRTRSEHKSESESPRGHLSRSAGSVCFLVSSEWNQTSRYQCSGGRGRDTVFVLIILLFASQVEWKGMEFLLSLQCLSRLNYLTSSATDSITYQCSAGGINLCQITAFFRFQKIQWSGSLKKKQSIKEAIESDLLRSLYNLVQLKHCANRSCCHFNAQRDYQL